MPTSIEIGKIRIWSFGGLWRSKEGGFRIKGKNKSVKCENMEFSWPNSSPIKLEEQQG
jgi:hypothetical protein